MVNIVKGGGRAHPTLGYHQDGMYARKWPLPLYELADLIFCAVFMDLSQALLHTLQLKHNKETVLREISLSFCEILNFGKTVLYKQSLNKRLWTMQMSKVHFAPRW
jgi:hypothetical protein